MKNKRIFIIILIILLIPTFFIIKNKAKVESDKNFDLKIKSGNLSTDYTITEALGDIEKFELNTVNVPVVININNLSSDHMTIDEASKKKAIELIQQLKTKEIKIILEPYPWIADGSEYETEWNPRDINAFFWNWKTDVLKPLIEDIANPYHVYALNIGTSFNHMEYAEEYWTDTVDYVRKHYKGLVTYRTSWWITAVWDKDTFKDYEAKLSNRLFSKLDFISIAAYFELTDNDTNSVETLVSSLTSTQINRRKQDVKEEIKNFHDKWKKPIFFGELGFPRTIKASVHPWDPLQSKVMNNVEQANCFEAYRRVFENEAWMIGFSVFALGERSDDKLYYPSDESAAVIKNWYKDLE